MTQPGFAVITRDMTTGRRTVVLAAPTILVAADFLGRDAGLDPGVWVPDDCGGVLTLDSDGEYRYRCLDYDEELDRYVFKRIEGEQ